MKMKMKMKTSMGSPTYELRVSMTVVAPKIPTVSTLQNNLTISNWVVNITISNWVVNIKRMLWTN